MKRSHRSNFILVRSSKLEPVNTLKIEQKTKLKEFGVFGKSFNSVSQRLLREANESLKVKNRFQKFAFMLGKIECFIL